MTALERLAEKIEQWKQNHEAIKSENATLKEKLSTVSSDESKKDDEIAMLKYELEEKDVEIEKIITQVEALLG